MKINLVMILRDEEASLRRCLKAAAPLVDEIIIADTGSKDKTWSIGEEMGAKMFSFPWQDDFSAARNFALDQSDGDWNLVLDGDEFIIEGSREQLEKTIKNHSGDWLGLVKRLDIFESQGERQQALAILPRLLPSKVRYRGKIHEQPDLAAAAYPVPLTILHEGYLRHGKGERNLKLIQQEAENAPYDCYWQFQLAVTLRNMGKKEESLGHFRRFYYRSSLSDRYRAQGIVLYLYTLADIGTEDLFQEGLELIKAEEENLGDRPDFVFACGLFYMKLVLFDTKRYIAYFPRIEESWLKCLALGEKEEDGSVLGTGSFKAAYNLGVFYELNGDLKKAADFYKMALSQGYAPAGKRLSNLGREQGN